MNKIHFDPALIDSARQQPDTSKRIDIQQEDFVTKNQASYHNDNETYVQSPGATLNDQQKLQVNILDHGPPEQKIMHLALSPMLAQANMPSIPQFNLKNHVQPVENKSNQQLNQTSHLKADARQQRLGSQEIANVLDGGNNKDSIITPIQKYPMQTDITLKQNGQDPKEGEMSVFDMFRDVG